MSIDRRTFAIAAAAAGLHAGGALAQPRPAWPAPDADIRRILTERVDGRKAAVGIVVGALAPAGRRFVGYGRLAADDPRAPGRDTVYEIGSVTKVFTCLLFAEMVRRGEVGLEDPVSTHLPAGVRTPARDGRPITLLDLATHTSGLPTFPPLPGAQPANVRQMLEGWYAATPRYTHEDAYAFLADFEPPRAPGARWEYSNFGTSLLAHALSRRVGSDYAALLERRVLRPLGLRDTALQPTPAMARRMAAGHEGELVAAPRWELGFFEPGGGLLSTADDLLSFVRVFIPGSGAPLQEAAAIMLAHRRPSIERGVEQAMGWEVVALAGTPFLSKGGLTRGQTATLVCDPAAGTAVAVLCNSDKAPTDIARHLLRPELPLSRSYTVVSVAPEVLARYVGEFKSPSGTLFAVERVGTGLGMRMMGSPPAPMVAIADNRFAMQMAGAEIEFRPGPNGAVDAFAIQRPGQPEVIATRIP
jgi:serine-type D-Ala-D-Ala carboxypeptidase/endopeptidase